MTRLNEALRANDLRKLVRPIFEIDAYSSKIGDDHEIAVLSFTVTYSEPAKDLENFFEMGYNFVLDSDVSPGETDDGYYRVFVEIERSRHIAENIYELLDGLGKLTGIETMKFRYFKSFKTHDATLEELQAIVPKNKEEYLVATDSESTDNYSNFFGGGHADDVSVIGESIKFTRNRHKPLYMNIVGAGPVRDLYNTIPGRIMMEHDSIAEIRYYTRYIGEYNINKIGNTFLLENRGWAIALEAIT